MKIWHVQRQDECGYDEYDSFVCAAEDEQSARLTHPSGSPYVWTGRKWVETRPFHWEDTAWPAPSKLIVEELGTSNDDKPGVLCASFNAG